MRKLSPDQLNRFYTNKLKEQLSAGYIRNMHGLLHKALAYAVLTKKVVQNVCDLVKPPRYVSPEQHALTEEQAQHLLDVAQGHRLEVVLNLALVTGMRRGEIVGLKWSDIDLGKKTLHVRRTVSRVSKLGLVVTATILLAAGVPAHVVQELLGHSHVNITLGIYGHVTPSMHEEAVKKIGNILKKHTGEK